MFCLVFKKLWQLSYDQGAGVLDHASTKKEINNLILDYEGPQSNLRLLAILGYNQGAGTLDYDDCKKRIKELIKEICSD